VFWGGKNDKMGFGINIINISIYINISKNRKIIIIRANIFNIINVNIKIVKVQPWSLKAKDLMKIMLPTLIIK